jgi:uncharacterized protein with FMN-binding domain
MRRITLWLFSTIAALVLLFSYRTSTNSTAGATAVAQAPATAGTTAPDPAASTSGSKTSTGTKTYTGSVAQTRWGPVQVQLKVTNKKITNVSVIQFPNGNGKDQEINSQALPILTQETVEAQSAQIDMVSGATVTSDGYLESLQSALDQAGL